MLSFLIAQLHMAYVINPSTTIRAVRVIDRASFRGGLSFSRFHLLVLLAIRGLAHLYTSLRLVVRWFKRWKLFGSVAKIKLPLLRSSVTGRGKLNCGSRVTRSCELVVLVDHHFAAIAQVKGKAALWLICKHRENRSYWKMNAEWRHFERNHKNSNVIVSGLHLIKVSSDTNWRYTSFNY